MLVLCVVSGPVLGVEQRHKRLDRGGYCAKDVRREAWEEEPGEEGERAVMGNQGKGQDGEGEPSGL